MNISGIEMSWGRVKKCSTFPHERQHYITAATAACFAAWKIHLLVSFWALIKSFGISSNNFSSSATFITYIQFHLKKAPKIIWPIQAIFNSIFNTSSNKHMPYHSHSHTNIYFMEIYFNFSVQRRKMLTCYISPCCCDVCKHIINGENEKHI